MSIVETRLCGELLDELNSLTKVEPDPWQLAAPVTGAELMAEFAKVAQFRQPKPTKSSSKHSPNPSRNPMPENTRERNKRGRQAQ